MNLNLDKTATMMANKTEAENTVILANVIELASCVLAKMAGTNIANSVNSSPATKNVLTAMVAKHVEEMINNNAVDLAK